MIFEIDEEQDEKIKMWLDKIRVEDEYFPRLIYMFIPGDIGVVTIVKERVTGEELNITDVSKW